jgi:catechol 2,3-dioxygenase-like lactoylglutathione lyase family enzyme
MEPRLNLVSLGVRDVGRALRFYRDGLGWKPVFHQGDFALFDVGGVALALYPRDLLAGDAGVARDPGGFGGVTLAQNVRSEAEVDRVLAAACAAGATLLRAATKKDWGGYSGYFADPDGHPWEVAWAPQFTLDERGRLVL